MNLSLLTLAFDPETGGFPAQPLRGIEGEILSVVEHFFHYGGLPHLLLVVHHRGAAPARSAAQEPRVDPRAALATHERPLFERLSAWRASRANADGVSAFVVLTNQQMVEIARRRPGSLGALREVNGVGEGKSTRYGKEILEIIRADAPPAPEAAPVAP